MHEIEKLGYKVECQVGESGFRIELAVWHPDPNRGYLLGIECDGATYHSDRAAHLRDVWRETILCGRGWKLYRVWSTRWWHNREEEIEKLRDALAVAVAHSHTEPLPAAAPTVEMHCLEPCIEDAQERQDMVPNQHQLEPSHVGAKNDLTSKFDHDMTLGQLRDKLASNGEFKGSWERFLDFVKLPRGLGLKKDTTVAEARRAAAT
jgi:REase_MTES_1575